MKKFGQLSSKLYEQPELVFPEKSRIPFRIFKLALTQDQVEVLRILESFYSKVEKEKIVFVLTANRGRGKSSVIGIGVGWLAHRLRRAKGKCNIVVTSPSPANVQEIFRFSRKVLEIFNHKVEVLEDEEGFIHKLTAKGIDIEYVAPFEALRTRGDLLVVDEAASIPVPLLFKLQFE